MNRRLTLVALLVATTSTACTQDEWTSQTIELGISADLSTVTFSAWGEGEGYLAAGTSGTIVYWDSRAPKRRDRFVWTTDIGDHDLHALGDLLGEGSLVVGDGGTAALTTDGRSWASLDLGVDADLYAIVAGIDTWVVGDGVVLRKPFDGEWTEVPPPAGGWGDLRAGWGGHGLHLVGLDGVVWTNHGPSWTAEAIGTNADLFAVSYGPGPSYLEEEVAVVGAEGTFLLRRGAGYWERVDTGLTVDFIRYSGELLLTAEGELFEVHQVGGEVELSSFRTHPGALGFERSPLGLAVVGADGLAIQLTYREPAYW